MNDEKRKQPHRTSALVLPLDVADPQAVEAAAGRGIPINHDELYRRIGST